MAKPKKVEDIRNARDLEKWARYHGADIENGKGSHAKVRGPDGGICVYPRHGNEDFAPGTRGSIIKTLIAIGLGVFIVLCFMYPELWDACMGIMKGMISGG